MPDIYLGPSQLSAAGMPPPGARPGRDLPSTLHARSLDFKSSAQTGLFRIHVKVLFFPHCQTVSVDLHSAVTVFAWAHTYGTQLPAGKLAGSRLGLEVEVSVIWPISFKCVEVLPLAHPAVWVRLSCSDRNSLRCGWVATAERQFAVNLVSTVVGACWKCALCDVTKLVSS